MQSDALLNYVTQGGSFGLIVGLVVYALRYGIPKAFAVYESQAATFAAEIKEQRKEFLATLDRMEAQRGQEHAEKMRVLAALTAEVKELADKTAEHRSLLDECQHRHPLPVQKGG